MQQYSGDTMHQQNVTDPLYPHVPGNMALHQTQLLALTLLREKGVYSPPQVQRCKRQDHEADQSKKNSSALLFILPCLCSVC